MVSSYSNALRLITLPQEAGTYTYGSDRRPSFVTNIERAGALLFGMRAKRVSVPMVKHP